MKRSLFVILILGMLYGCVSYTQPSENDTKILLGVWIKELGNETSKELNHITVIDPRLSFHATISKDEKGTLYVDLFKGISYRAEKVSMLNDTTYELKLVQEYDTTDYRMGKRIGIKIKILDARNAEMEYMGKLNEVMQEKKFRIKKLDGPMK